MASDQTLRAIITVLDRTAEPIRQINTRWAAMSSPLRHIGSRISELGELTGIKNIGEHAKEALEHVRHLGEGLMEMAGPLAALSAAGSIAGLVEMTRSTAEFAENLDIGSKMTGVASEKLAGWHYAATLVNVDVDRMDRGFTYLNRTISDAASGKAKDAETMLRRMGLNNTPQHMVSTADALKAISAETKHLVDSGQIQMATSMLAKFFGERQGAQLMPLFEMGPDKLNEILAGAKEAGISLTAAQTEAGTKFMEQFKGMEASVQGLKIAIGDELLPVLTPVVETMRTWLNVNREWVAAKIGDAVSYLSDKVKSVDWADIGADIKAIGADVGWLVEKIGGIGPALAILLTISFAPSILAFGQLGVAVATASAKFLLFPAAALVADLARMVPAIRAARDIWAAFDLVLAANPLGVAVIAATALAGAAYEIWQHWQPIEGFFARLWQNVVDKFNMAWKEIKPIIDSIDRVASGIGKILGGSSAAPGVAGGYVDPTSGMFVPDPVAAAAAKPSLTRLPGAAAAAGGARGETHVVVDFKNVPPGTTVSTQSRGNAAAPDVNVGSAWAY